MTLLRKNSYTQILFLSLLLTVHCCGVSPANGTADTLSAKPMKDLVKRLLPRQAAIFNFMQISSDDGNDVFELYSSGDKIVIGGNNAISQAVGLNWYLKYYCNTSVSWFADSPIELPAKLPAVSHKIRKTTRCKYRFFLNYCTFGYTMPWWGWDDWQRLIDWMALNGVNMPLAITGQEAIWQKVWKEFGLSDEQIRSYFTGPAHLPWHRMANIDYWGGPLPQSYIDNQFELQKKILKRQREFGMTPALPAFAGHVPAALREVCPDAKINKLGEWGGFPDKYRACFLDPQDALFAKIQRSFLEEQARHFGTDHIYGTDPFNEVEPPSWEPQYLAEVAKTIYSSMADVDKDAVWLQMAWTFYWDKKHWTKPRMRAMCNAVPQDKMIFLDYVCEKTEVWKTTESFYGQPYIWCYLGNFGGSTFLIGNIKTVDNRITKLLSGSKNGKVWGLGSTLEALDITNPMMYEFVLEKAWSPDSVDLNAWIDKYAQRRCGQPDKNAEAAWKILLEKVYIKPVGGWQGTVISLRPCITPGKK
jgi:alpha-N-acetylglucosaminidase